MIDQCDLDVLESPDLVSDMLTYLVVTVAEALAPSILQVAVEGHWHSGQL